MANHSSEETANRLREVRNAIDNKELLFDLGDLAVNDVSDAESAASVEITAPSGLKYSLQLVPIGS